MAQADIDYNNPASASQQGRIYRAPAVGRAGGTPRATLPTNPAAPDAPLAPDGPANPTAPPTTPAPPPPAPAGAPAGANTDGYAVPSYIASNFGSTIFGWDQGKWADANHQTPKYVVGRILSQYAPTIDNLRRATEEIAKAYPGATFNGKDKVTIPGIGTFDVLANSGAGVNMSWWWGPEGSADQAQASAAAVGPVNRAAGPDPGAVPQAGSATGSYSSRQASTSAGTLVGATDMGNNMVRLADGSMLPKDHPLYLAAQANDAAAGAAGAQGPGSTTVSGNIAQGGFSPTGYVPYQSVPVMTAQEALIQKMLATPETMSAQNVQQLQEQQKEMALSAQETFAKQLASGAAARGIDQQSGVLNAQRQRGNEAMQTDLLTGYRDVALKKMTQDRADQIGAVATADDYLGNRSQRDLDAWNANFKQWDASQGYLRQDRSLDQDDARIGNQAAQFAMAQDLAYKQYQDAMAEWRARLNFDYQRTANASNESGNA